ncbi:carbohydrate ABC transporter permease [Paenibacillus sp. HWE-109]|uniref:carbohydrate ABC transporter permease n=1 Tax=Paenibacillus sp. HWE-109 TaxID=1306526 RepID=UPI001EDE8285|nr:carbohydrate ABC transporter permease [Paenibacillus sp. HWE-109]UKS24752.1 carbohydrate ABC transporter permease [Paenibacillus sp. HWE-109]
MKPTWDEKIFYIVNYIFLGLVALSCVLPLLHIVSLSLSSYQAIVSGQVTLWPKGWTWEAYKALYDGTNLVKAFRNSVIITVVGVVLSMVFTILAAYPLAKKFFYARRFFTLFIVFTMLFGTPLIPLFLIVKSLGLLNTYGAIWMPGLISAFNMLVLRTFIMNVPEELEEAARLDGCGEWKLLATIILPLSMPVIATLTLFYGVGYWNSFLHVLMFLNDSTRMNLAVMIQQMVASQSVLQELNAIKQDDLQQMTPESIKSAGVIVLIVPMLLIYPFLQKYFVKGVMIGAIKG